MKRIIVKIICMALVIVYILYSQHVFSILSSELLLGKKETTEYLIMELWNIDTFEGGSVSRAVFLEKRAIEFEKTHKGSYFVIKNYTPEQAINKISQNTLPSVISFGMGFGKYIKNYLLGINNDNVRSDLLSYCKEGDAILALPYILGGYSIIHNKTNENYLNNVVSFKTEYLDINKALQTKKLTNYQIKDMSSFELYSGFINDKFD